MEKINILAKRWLGGSNKGMSETTAKIQISKLRKDHPQLTWEIAPVEGLSGRFEARGYVT